MADRGGCCVVSLVHPFCCIVFVFVPYLKEHDTSVALGALSKQRGYSKIEDLRLLKSNLNLSAYACVCVCVCVQLRPEKQKSQIVACLSINVETTYCCEIYIM